MDYSEIRDKLSEKELKQLQDRLSDNQRRILIYERAKTEKDFVVSLAIGDSEWEFMSFQLLEFKALIFTVVKDNTLLVRLE